MLWKFGFSTRRAKQGVNQAAIDGTALACFPIPLPPLIEQRRIVALLDKARAVRRLRRQADDLTAKLIPAIFHDMFGDPLSNDRDWPTELLAKLGGLDRGRSRHRPRDEPTLYGGPYPFIQTGDIANCDGWIAANQFSVSDRTATTASSTPNLTIFFRKVRFRSCPCIRIT